MYRISKAVARCRADHL